MIYFFSITRTGSSRGGNDMLLMFVSLWNNAASDFGNSGSKNTNIFNRVLGPSTDTINSKKTNKPVYVATAY